MGVHGVSWFGWILKIALNDSNFPEFLLARTELFESPPCPINHDTLPSLSLSLGLSSQFPVDFTYFNIFMKIPKGFLIFSLINPSNILANQILSKLRFPAEHFSRGIFPQEKCWRRDRRISGGISPSSRAITMKTIDFAFFSSLRLRHRFDLRIWRDARISRVCCRRSPIGKSSTAQIASGNWIFPWVANSATCCICESTVAHADAAAYTYLSTSLLRYRICCVSCKLTGN